MGVGEQVVNAVEGRPCFHVTLCSQHHEGGHLVAGVVHRGSRDSGTKALHRGFVDLDLLGVVRARIWLVQVSSSHTSSRLSGPISSARCAYALEAPVIASLVRVLSARDVDAALVEGLGPEATLSMSTVARVCEAIKDEFET
jgi:hypothetical protein